MVDLMADESGACLAVQLVEEMVEMLAVVWDYCWVGKLAVSTVFVRVDKLENLMAVLLVCLMVGWLEYSWVELMEMC